LQPLGSDRHEVRARPDGLNRERLERLPLERGERLGHRARGAAELPATGKPAIDPERGLLAAGAVQLPQAARLEPELEQLLERLGLLVAELALVDRRDERREPPAPLVVLDEREHGLRLAERDLARLALERDATHARPR